MEARTDSMDRTLAQPYFAPGQQIGCNCAEGLRQLRDVHIGEV